MSSPDPVSILILLAANGYAADILACASLTRDPDLWSYLARVPIGQSELTWLHEAAALGHLDRVRFLCDTARAPLEAISLTDRFCKCRRTALLQAFVSDQEGAVEVLKKHGANIDVVNPYWSFLHQVVSVGDASTTMLLLKYGANPNTLTRYHLESPLTILCRYLLAKKSKKTRYFECVYLLLKAGADPNLLDAAGISPIAMLVESLHSFTPDSVAARILLLMKTAAAKT